MNPFARNSRFSPLRESSPACPQPSRPSPLLFRFPLDISVLYSTDILPRIPLAQPPSSFSRRIPRLRQPSRPATRALHPSARIKADILARHPARQPPPYAPPRGTLARRAAPPCTPVTRTMPPLRAPFTIPRAVPQFPSRAALRVPRALPRHPSHAAPHRPARHSPPYASPRAASHRSSRQGRRPRPASPDTTRRIRTSRTNVSRETFRRKSFPRDIRNREAPPVPRIRTNETLPNGARGAATVAAAPLARRSLMQFASARKRL